MLNVEVLEAQLAQLPLYIYGFVDPKELEFSQRIRYICERECPMYGTTWACPPAVGSVEACRAHCAKFARCLGSSAVAEVADIANLQETLDTRAPHEELTNQVAGLLRQQKVEPFVLSTEACALCRRCAYLDGQPCRHPEKMHPCVESQGINVIPVLEKLGLSIQYGENVVTWVSLLLFSEE